MFDRLPEPEADYGAILYDIEARFRMKLYPFVMYCRLCSFNPLYGPVTSFHQIMFM